jgi:hypothetical protein
MADIPRDRHCLEPHIYTSPSFSDKFGGLKHANLDNMTIGIPKNKIQKTSKDNSEEV